MRLPSQQDVEPHVSIHLERLSLGANWIDKAKC